MMVSDFFNQQTFMLADNSRKGNNRKVRERREIGGEKAKETPRVSLPELELAYRQNGSIFNAINKTTQAILSANIKILGDEDSVNIVESFLDNVGSNGGDYDWDDILESNIRYPLIYGVAYNELINDVKTNKLIDLDIYDPKSIDFVRDFSNNIILGENRRPIGYVEVFENPVTPVVKYNPPKQANITSNMVYIPKEKIVRYTLYTYGKGIHSLGLIEPSYKSILNKMNTEEALAKSWYRLGFPILAGFYGDINNPPTPQSLTDMTEKLINLDNESVVSFPYYADIKLIESKRPESLKEQLNYYEEQVITPTGVPKAFATGSGEATNRATLGRQEYFMKLGLRYYVNKISRIIEKRIFKRICDDAGLKTYPKFVFGEIALEELDSKAMRLERYARNGLIVPNESLEKYIRSMENLPPKGDI